jgi:hypothetical protein
MSGMNDVATDLNSTQVMDDYVSLSSQPINLGTCYPGLRTFGKAGKKLVGENNYLDNPELLCSIYRLPDTAIREIEEHDCLLPASLQQHASGSRLQWGSRLEAVYLWCWSDVLLIF